MRAFVLSDRDGTFSQGVTDVADPVAGSDETLIRVEFSGINFKDTMVAASPSRVRRRDELVGGVDAAGLVIASDRFAAGTPVVVYGGTVGTGRDGGFAELIAAPNRYVSALPAPLTTRQAMIAGTAGFTAMQSILALEHAGLTPGGEVLVTGATGGVGSMAVVFLARRGYRTVASTGSEAHRAWLMGLGAAEVIGRSEIDDRSERVLAPERWDGAVDCVGGTTLHHILRSLRYGAAVAASGLVASAELATTVYPFITRHVSLLGIDSVEVPSDERTTVWNALAAMADSVPWETLVHDEIGLAALPDALDVVRRGDSRGRYLVNPGA